MTSPTFPSQPFTHRAAIERGISIAALKSSSYQRLLRGVYVASSVPVTPRLLARAALVGVPKAEFISHHTAAAMYRSISPSSSSIHVGTTSTRRSTVPNVHMHRYSQPPELTTWHGLPITTPAQTFADLAGHLDLVDLVILGDSMLHAGLVEVAQLLTAADKVRGRGAPTVRRAARLARPGAESPTETKARLLLTLAGLPEPELQLVVRLPGGRTRRLDMAYREHRFAIEYDGRHHVAREQQWSEDIARREELERLGWRFVILTSTDLLRDADVALERVVAGMRSVGMAVPSLSPGWRAYFPASRAS